MKESKVGSFFKAAVMWLIFAVLLIVALGSMFTSFLSGLIMLVAASLFVPKLNRLVTEETNYTITPGFRFAGVLVCLFGFTYTTNSAINVDRAQRAAQESAERQQKAEQAVKEKREYVAANKDTILTELNALIAKKDLSAATALGSKYSNAGSFEIDQALASVSQQKAEADKQQLKSTLNRPGNLGGSLV